MFRKRNARELQILTNGGDLLIDRNALEVGDQLISDLQGGISVPLRPPIPTLEMRHLDRTPDKTGSIQLETNDAAAPATDSTWVLVTSHKTFDHAENGLDPTVNNPLRSTFNAKNLLAVMGAIFLIVCVVITGLRAPSSDPPAPSPPAAVQEVPAPANPTLQTNPPAPAQDPRAPVPER